MKALKINKRVGAHYRGNLFLESTNSVLQISGSPNKHYTVNSSMGMEPLKTLFPGGKRMNRIKSLQSILFLVLLVVSQIATAEVRSWGLKEFPLRAPFRISKTP